MTQFAFKARSAYVCDCDKLLRFCEFPVCNLRAQILNDF